MRRIIALLVLLSVACCFAEPRRITVHGTASIAVAPDYLEWNVHLSSKAPTLAESHRESEKALAGLMAVFKKHGVGQSDYFISALSHGKSAIYRDGERVPDGFYSSRKITFYLRELNTYADVLADLVAVKDMDLKNVLYRSSKEIETRARARRLALEQARTKAEEMGKVLGMMVLSPIEIQESSSSVPVSTYNVEIEPDDRQNVFGTVEVQARVTVAFEMAPKSNTE
ncbi:MAG: SIMPL domain-containing protein [Kiritimatiellae bacterium]|nr:SIMPL domain-containing protein [Kiritimatiellia bacterium]